ncbi:MAG: anti-sigma factor family protein [Blastocatellia bacterium]
MNCETFEQSIALYVEGDLPPLAATRVHRHLDSCAECRDFAGELEESQRLLRGLRAETPPADALFELRRAVLDEITRREPMSGLWRWLRWPRWQYATLAAMLLLLTLAAIQSRATRTTARQTTGITAAPAPHNSHTFATPAPERNRPREIRRHENKIARIVRHTSRPIAPEPLPATTKITVIPNGAFTSAAPFSSPFARALESAEMVAAEEASEKAREKARMLAVLVESQLLDASALPEESWGDGAADQQLTRLEFQTRDPHITIIWLASAQPRATPAPE